MDANPWLELLGFHRFLLGQTKNRLERYRQAIASGVRPGDTVLDLGAGSGALSFFACQAGARRVYAIEHGPAIELAKLLARENGFGDRIVFVNGASQDLDLPEPADVLVTDTVGLWQPGGLGALIDARDRLMKPGAVLIPRSVEFFIAPAELPEAYRRHVEFWSRNRQGIDLAAIRELATNHCYPVKATPAALLTEPAALARMNSAQMKGTVLRLNTWLMVHRAGTLHGLCAWIETALTGDIALSNRPGATTTNYAQGFFPLDRPVAVREGDRVSLRVESHDSAHWRWQVAVERRPGFKAATVEQFDHSTFRGIPLSGASLRNRSPDHVPSLSALGHAERFLLGLSDGKTSIEQLRANVRAHYPNLFKSQEEANQFVAEVLNRCG